MATKTISTRKATVADIPELEKIINYAYRGGKQTKSWTGEEHLISGARVTPAELKELIEDTQKVLVVAEADDSGRQQVVGCVVLETEGADGYIGMLSVDPDVQSGGIGTALMKRAESEAKGLRREGIVMWILSGRPELQSWYERMGYRPTGDTKPFPEGEGSRWRTLKPDLHFVVLRKAL